MASKTVLVDDLDGTEGADTVEFEFEGEPYEIDLSAGNAEEMADFMARQRAEYLEFMKKYAQAGRKASRRRQSTPATGGSGRTKEELAAIRAWAREQGMQVNDTGRIALAIMAAYDEAVSESQDADDTPVNDSPNDEVTGDAVTPALTVVEGEQMAEGEATDGSDHGTQRRSAGRSKR